MPGTSPTSSRPSEHLVGDRDLLDQADRVVQRHDMAHAAEADALGARAAADGVEAGRRHPALVGAEMMLDAEAVIESKFVAQLELAPELLIALGRRHACLAPDMGEMRELHGTIPPRSTPGTRVTRWA